MCCKNDYEHSNMYRLVNIKAVNTILKRLKKKTKTKNQGKRTKSYNNHAAIAPTKYRQKRT